VTRVIYFCFLAFYQPAVKMLPRLLFVDFGTCDRRAVDSLPQTQDFSIS
jgi:hypothetical protein